MTMKNPINNRAPGDEENCAVVDACRHSTFWYNVSEENRAKHVRLYNIVVKYLKSMKGYAWMATGGYTQFQGDLAKEGIDSIGNQIPLATVDNRPKQDCATGMLASLLLQLPGESQKEAMRLLESMQQEREDLKDELQAIYYDAYVQVGQYGEPSAGAYENFYKSTVNAFEFQKKSATQVVFEAFKDRIRMAKMIMSLSSRDWSKDTELATLYQIIVEEKHPGKVVVNGAFVPNAPEKKTDLNVVVLGQDEGLGNGKSIAHENWVRKGRPRGEDKHEAKPASDNKIDLTLFGIGLQHDAIHGLEGDRPEYPKECNQTICLCRNCVNNSLAGSCKVVKDLGAGCAECLITSQCSYPTLDCANHMSRCSQCVSSKGLKDGDPCPAYVQHGWEGDKIAKIGSIVAGCCGYFIPLTNTLAPNAPIGNAQAFPEARGATVHGSTRSPDAVATPDMPRPTEKVGDGKASATDDDPAVYTDDDGEHHGDPEDD